MNWKKFFGIREQVAFEFLQGKLRDAMDQILLLQEAKFSLTNEYQTEKHVLTQQANDLRDEIATLKKSKEMEEREIKHLVRLEKEKNDVEFLKKEEQIKAEYAKKEMALQKEYHEKAMQLIEKEHAQVKEIYQQIMERLPNVNMEIRRGGPDTVVEKV